MPINKVALGLLSRIINLIQQREKDDDDDDDGVKFSQFWLDLGDSLSDEQFCTRVLNASAVNRREKSKSMKSKGVDSILEDAVCFSFGLGDMYPTLRDPQPRFFAMNKADTIRKIVVGLARVGSTKSEAVLNNMLAVGRKFSNAPPDDDQKCLLAASAEIFSGVLRGVLDTDTTGGKLEETLLPWLSSVLNIVSHSAVVYWSDGLKYGVHGHITDRRNGGVSPLLLLVIDKLSSVLSKDGGGGGDSGTKEAAGSFSSQSKWLKIVCALSIECFYLKPGEHLMKMDGVKGVGAGAEAAQFNFTAWESLTATMQPLLLNAISHPFKNCREDVSAAMVQFFG